MTENPLLSYSTKDSRGPYDGGNRPVMIFWKDIDNLPEGKSHLVVYMSREETQELLNDIYRTHRMFPEKVRGSDLFKSYRA